MTDFLNRAFASELDVRSDGDGRTVYGIAVPFNKPTPIREWGQEYNETFLKGAFARTITERGNRVKFLYQHDSTAPIGRAVDLREDNAGLYAEFKVSKTQRGDEALELIRDGAIDSFSIGFKPIRENKRNGGKDIDRTEVALREVSAVTFPAYEGALVSGVRSLSDDDLSRAYEAFALLRAGKQLSSANVATLKKVLDLVAAADCAVDEAQPILAKLLGVANPDVAQDAAMKEGKLEGSGMTGTEAPGDGPADDRAETITVQTRAPEPDPVVEPVEQAATEADELVSVDDRADEDAIEERAWDADENVKRIPSDASASELHKMFAWCPDGDDVNKSDCKFPFHNVNADGTVGSANPDAASAGIAALNGGRGGTTVPAADRQSVYDKLAAVLKAAGKTPPPLRSDSGLDFETAIRMARVSMGVSL